MISQRHDKFGHCVSALHNQRLSSPGFKKPGDVVKWARYKPRITYGAKWADARVSLFGPR